MFVVVKGYRYDPEDGVHEENFSCNNRPDGKPSCQYIYITEEEDGTNRSKHSGQHRHSSLRSVDRD